MCTFILKNCYLIYKTKKTPRNTEKVSKIPSVVSFVLYKSTVKAFKAKKGLLLMTSQTFQLFAKVSLFMGHLNSFSDIRITQIWYQTDHKRSNFQKMEKNVQQKFDVINTLILKSHSDENAGSKGLSVPEICLFLCIRLLHGIYYLVTTFSIKFIYIYLYIYIYIY